MAVCLLDSGYVLGCKDAVGGLQEVYIATFTGGTTYTIDSTSAITSFDTFASSASTPYYKFQQRNETGEFIQEGQHSVENGTRFWQQTVNLTFHKRETAIRNTLLLLARNDLIVIIKDQNGRYWLIGKQNGAQLTASSFSSGKAYGDLSGSLITILGKEPSQAYEVTQAAIDGLIIL